MLLDTLLVGHIGLHERLHEEPGQADFDRVAMFQARLAHFAFVDQDPVHRAEVADVDAVRPVLDHGVLSRHFRVLHSNGAVRIPADDHRVGFNGNAQAGGGAC